MSPKVYVITGANRGIGLSLVKQFSSLENTIVIGTARKPANATELNEWIKSHSNVHVVKYDAELKNSAYLLADEVQKITDGVDVLIANAGIGGDSFETVLELPDEKWLEHYNINVLGPIFLFKAFHKLLYKNKTRHVIFISSLGGSISQPVTVSSSAYGQSKAALNYSVKEISYETQSDQFTVISIHPGIVDTELGRQARDRLVISNPAIVQIFDQITISPDESAKGISGVINALKVEDTGKFLGYDGSDLPF